MYFPSVGSDINCNGQPRSSKVKAFNFEQFDFLCQQVPKGFPYFSVDLVCKVDSPTSLKKRKIFLATSAE